MTRLLARLLAPAVLVAVALVVYLIVTGNLDRGGHHTSVTHTVVRRRERSRPRAGKSSAPTAYTVKPGDTLGAIAARTHVPLARLTALNPSLTPPYSLRSGQRLRLRR